MFAILDDWKLKWKAVAGFSVLGILIGALALNAALSNRMLTSISSEIVTRDVAGLSGLADLASDVKELRIIVYSYYNATDADDVLELEERRTKVHADLIEAVDAYAKVAGEDFAPEVAKLREAAAALKASDERVFELRRAGDLDGAIAHIKGEGKKASRAARDQIDALLQKSRERASRTSDDGVATAQWTLFATIAMALIALAGLGVISFVTDHTMAKPLDELTRATSTLAHGAEAIVPHRTRKDELGEIARAVELFRIAAVERAASDARSRAELEIVTSTLQDKLAALSAGDLTATIDQDFPPAFECIKSNLNEALASLRMLIGSVSITAETIRAATGEIAEASENLSQRTQANAANLEETTAAIAQMDGRFRLTAEAAERTVSRADGATATVSGGRSIADEAVQAMGRVSESAKGIDSVIEGLDKIAFQTRVLAMNAAVEAGRAGEAGRGFAVVADLVSALAMRAEEEAGRARDQLTATQSDIVTAVEMVQKVDQALSDIAKDVGEVHSLLGNMASDNDAQASAIGEISSAVTTMDQSTQQNAAMVEQTSAAARNLSEEVAALAAQAARFKTGAAPLVAATRLPAKPRAAKPKAAAGAYVSPVKALPLTVAATGHDDWNAF